MTVTRSPWGPRPRTSPSRTRTARTSPWPQFRGAKNVVLVFYPFAFSGICTGELCEIRDDLGGFVADDVQVLAVSCDHMFTQRAWADKEGYFFPLLSDFWPHGGGGAGRTASSTSRPAPPLRGTFLIDTEGVVRWSLVNEIGQARDFTGYHAALAELRG